MTILKLTLKSLLNRKLTTLLTIASITLSVLLLLSFERIRTGAKDSFNSTIAGVDLIAGARTSPLQLLLYSVFHIGDPINSISWDSYQQVKDHAEVEWTIPISLGDSHREHRVIGTNESFFEHYKYGSEKHLSLRTGNAFENTFEVVIGAEVAQKLNYKVGDQIILAHGTGVSFQDHSDMPFTITGILNRTLTPVDQSLYVSLEAIEAIHVGWESGAPSKEPVATPKDLNPTQVSAFFIKLKSKISVFEVQRFINDYSNEALTAALPGIVLTSLWKNLSFIERLLSVLMMLVFLSSLMSLFLVLLTSLKERRREMAILRSVGARPRFIFSLFVFESCFITVLGILSGGLLTLVLSKILAEPLIQRFGLTINLYNWSANDLIYMAGIFGISIVVGIIPAIMAYRNTLADGLTIKV